MFKNFLSSTTSLSIFSPFKMLPSKISPLNTVRQRRRFRQCFISNSRFWCYRLPPRRKLEIVTSNPGVFEVLEQLVQDYPTKTLGVGTVLNAEDAKNAIKFGAKFILSPAMVKGILDYASCCKVLYIPGAMTPTEILSAFNAGAKLVKVYPVSTMGGIQYIAALKKPFPHIPLIASQGITLDSVDEYIAQGATAVVLSDAIFNKKAMLERNFEAIYQLSCSAALCAVKAIERLPKDMEVDSIFDAYDYHTNEY